MNIEIPVINIKNGSIGIGVVSPTGSFKLQVSGTIGPSDNAVFNLGSTDKTWANGYINNVIGTASWASNALSASWAPDVTVTVLSASWASSSVSASYSPVEPSYSASISTVKQNTLVTGDTYTITASWSNNAVNANNIINTGSGNVISSSYRTFGSKTFTFGGSTYATGSTINMSVSRSAVVKICINGWWPEYGAIGYSSEYFIQNGGTGQPGAILRQDNNNGDGLISTQLRDNGSGNVFDILFKSSVENIISNTILSYEIIGQVNSIS